MPWARPERGAGDRQRSRRRRPRLGRRAAGAARFRADECGTHRRRGRAAVTVDFESAYWDDPAQGADDVVRLRATGASAAISRTRSSAARVSTADGAGEAHPGDRHAVGDLFHQRRTDLYLKTRPMTRPWSTRRSSAGRPSPTPGQRPFCRASSIPGRSSGSSRKCRCP